MSAPLVTPSRSLDRLLPLRVAVAAAAAVNTLAERHAALGGGIPFTSGAAAAARLLFGALARSNSPSDRRTEYAESELLNFCFGLVSFRLECTRAIIVRSLLRFSLRSARLFSDYIGFLLLLRRVRGSLFCPFFSVSIFRDGRAKESLWFDLERIRSYRAPAMA